MKTRNITPEEKAKLLAAYGLKKETTDIKTTVKMWLFFTGLSILLSLPIVFIFTLIAHFAHDLSWSTAINHTLPGLLIGPVLFALLYATVKFDSKKQHGVSKDIRKEIETGICHLKSFKILRLYKLIDEPANHETPHYLAVIDKNKVLAIFGWDITDATQLLSTIEVGFLPQSKVDVGVNFSGEPVKIEGTVETDNRWRNDDFSFYNPIKIKELPKNILPTLGFENI